MIGFPGFPGRKLPIFCFCMRQVYPSGRCGFVVKRMSGMGLKRWVLNPSAAASDDYVNKWKRGNPSLLGLGEKCGRSCSKVIKGWIQDKNFEWSKEGDMLNLGKAP